ncbi:hypothetical protein [Vibrio campbellii]|uniref:DUF2057 domain-containing protein n=1 Tax=Vibrio campbellii (strain ATCC BAA-1116) TaxID=2902295 RepID=A7MTG7_VIBC1|nr:hypothetical protein [Vibrio campbellii]ABU70650.1 hypothetical protein VIBHAR_01681 [Vibrio campbellii ATCC BAA-1116]AGU96322.1 hypothetical protein M892_04740 [Vibrio campbellii ATCC BAA-1116]MBT0124412.1 hypothetical protein [Vibrio campbellii]MBT0139340.1 hypothetical protein [Vibrio campbellii]MBT0144017.1 hypothetical protein [Vibrio campbellii]
MKKTMKLLISVAFLSSPAMATVEVDSVQLLSRFQEPISSVFEGQTIRYETGVEIIDTKQGVFYMDIDINGENVLHDKKSVSDDHPPAYDKYYALFTPESAEIGTIRLCAYSLEKPDRKICDSKLYNQ